MGSTTRVTLGPGFTTEAGFHETPAGRLFYVWDQPDDPGGDAVLIASPVMSEALKNNRREVMLARKLAAAGRPTLRFHPIGLGHSDGVTADLTVDSMARDTQAAAELLAARSDRPVSGLVASRLAALTSARAAIGASHVALWDPSFMGTPYIRDILRALLIQTVTTGAERKMADVLADLDEHGSVDVMGFSIGKPFHASAQGAEMPEGDASVTACHITLFRQSPLTKSEQRAIDRWIPDAELSTDNTELTEAWWFHEDADVLKSEETLGLDTAIVEDTADWLMSRSGVSA